MHYVLTDTRVRPYVIGGNIAGIVPSPAASLHWRRCLRWRSARALFSLEPARSTMSSRHQRV